MIVFDPPQEQEEFFYHNKKQKGIPETNYSNSMKLELLSIPLL